MVKKIYLGLMILLSVAAAVSAQDQTGMLGEEFSLRVAYSRENVDVRDLNSEDLKIDRANDSVGVDAEYFHYFGSDRKTGRRGVFGIGIDFGLSFNLPGSPGSSKIAYGSSVVGFKLKARNSKVQPWISGGVGAARKNFKGIVVVQDGSGGISFSAPPWTVVYQGGVGLDFPLNKKRNRGISTAFKYKNTGWGNDRQHNFSAGVGFFFGG